jgi:hypothetical protein
MAEPPRRFPTPWHAKKIPGGYVVRYANGRERIPAKLRAYAIAGGTEAGLSKVRVGPEDRSACV